MINPPPTYNPRISMVQATAYVAARHGLVVSRQTLYNWYRKGRGGVFLKTQEVAGRLLTTKGYVDDFIATAPRV